MTGRTKTRLIEGGAGFAANPVLQWMIVLVLAALTIIYFLPWFLKKFVTNGAALVDSGRKAFSSALDSATSTISSAIGAPTSQLAADRSALDTLKGVLAYSTQDRAISDIYDSLSITRTILSPGDELYAMVTSGSAQNTFSGTAQEYLDLLKSKGYMDAAGNLTAAGQAAIQNGTIPHMANN